MDPGEVKEFWRDGIEKGGNRKTYERCVYVCVYLHYQTLRKEFLIIFCGLFFVFILKRYKFHSGVDLYAANGTPVLAMSDGIVTRASFFAGYGRCVDIKHISGYTSRYAHLSKINVKIGDRVTKGFVVGNVGSSGRSTGHHLHVELARYNKVINPFSVKMIPEEVGRVKNKNAFNNTKKYVEKILAVAD